MSDWTLLINDMVIRKQIIYNIAQEKYVAIYYYGNISP